MVDVLLSWAIPLWLSGLQIERLAPQKQELARILKSGACEAIERAFRGDAPETPLKALPASDAWQQAQEGQEGVASGRVQMLPSESWQQQMQAGLAEMAQGLGQVQRGVNGLGHTQEVILTRLAAVEHRLYVEGTLDLMPERIGHLYVLARARRDKTSIPITDTLATLAKEFGVEEIADIPAAQWPEVVTALEFLLGLDEPPAQGGQLVALSITPERLAALKALPYEEYLRTPEWRARRQESLRRARYRCQMCNSPEPPLEAHHRTYERLGEELPEDLFVLCKTCHQWHHRKPDAPTRRA
jgi:hypothetical protein